MPVTGKEKEFAARCTSPPHGASFHSAGFDSARSGASGGSLTSARSFSSQCSDASVASDRAGSPPLVAGANLAPKPLYRSLPMAPTGRLSAAAGASGSVRSAFRSVARGSGGAQLPPLPHQVLRVIAESRVPPRDAFRCDVPRALSWSAPAPRVWSCVTSSG